MCTNIVDPLPKLTNCNRENLKEGTHVTEDNIYWNARESVLKVMCLEEINRESENNPTLTEV